MGNLIRWTIWGLAGVFAMALYLNWNKATELPGAGEVAVLPPESVAVSDTAEEEAVGEDAQASDESTGGGEQADAVSETVEAEEFDVTSNEGEQIVAASGVIRIPGDDASYTLLNAFRRDDGAIEITSERALGDDRTTTIRLVRCAPLEVGVIAQGDAERNETPEMARITLGNAAATLAATACGAMK
ncbi:MAG: hypothetical protein ACR2OY_00495 [Boseongicola sp.]